MTRETFHEAGISLRIIVAMAENRVIGRAGTLPWSLPEDLKHFKKRTLGHPIVMGRKTWESLPRRPLPGRRNLILSRALPNAEGAEVIPSFESLLTLGLQGPVFVIGGADIFRQALPWCDAIVLTLVEGRPEGDCFMPSFESEFVFDEKTRSLHEGFELREYHRKTEPSATKLP